MPRPMLYPDTMPARLPAGTIDRMRAVLRDGETVADLLRVAVEAELARRAAEAGTPGEQAPASIGADREHLTAGACNISGFAG